MLRVGRLSAVLGVALILAACGASERTLSVRQVASALRSHGVPVSITRSQVTQSRLKNSGVTSLLKLMGSDPGLIASFGESSPDVDGLIFDTIAHAVARFNYTLPGPPIHASDSSHTVIGRCFRVATT